MRKLNLFFAFLLTISLLTSCETTYKFTVNTQKKSVLAESFDISVSEKNGTEITKALFYINGKAIEANNLKATINTSEYGVGKHLISVMVYYGEGKSKKLNNSFEVFAKNPPTIYTYKLIKSYPHDSKAYTQGLEYHNGFLYETTGRRGQSTLRKVEIKTGKVLKKIDLDKEYFGEGLTIFNDKVYFLTWKARKGFVYNLETFELEKEFKYNRSNEGWGLTHNEKELLKSDGTDKIWFLDPTTLKEKRYIQAYTNTRNVKDLNELELINGKLYANKWQQNSIVIIDPTTGVVEGIADLEGLKREVEKTQKLVPQDEVLNGIAFDAKNNRLFVTGKNWNRLFEIQLIKK